jgi:sugar phosphate isomerase/epimerase
MCAERTGATRRDFMKMAAGAAGLASAAWPWTGSLAARPPVAPRRGGGPAARARVGCVSWCFHTFEPGSKPEEAIDIIGQLGFEGIELILLARSDIEGYWSDQKVDQLKLQLERNRLQVSQFVIFQPVVEGLSSLDAEERKRNLGYFEAGCRIGKRLGAPLVNIVAPWARELSRPGGGYLPRYYDLDKPKPGEKFHLDIAGGFDWDRLWSSYVEITRECLARARSQGMKFSIEQHTHTMVPDVASFLRLADAIKDPDLGLNLDIGWIMSQREYPPVSIHKAGGRLFNLHARDIDGHMRSFVNVGEGVMDFRAVAEALKAVGFGGFIDLEQDKYGDMKAVSKRYLDMMKEYLA